MLNILNETRLIENLEINNARENDITCKVN